MSGRAGRAKAAARPAAVLLWATAGPGVGGALVLLALLPHADDLRGGGLPLAAGLLVLGGLGCGLALIPTHLLSLVNGWSLGVPAGLAVTLLATTAAAGFGHAAGRALAGPTPRAWAEKSPRGRRSAPRSRAPLRLGRRC